MNEYAIMFDYGAYTVMKRDPTSLGSAERLGSFPTLEAALAEIQIRTGSPVLLRVITEAR
jgi:hypothetical protein